MHALFVEEERHREGERSLERKKNGESAGDSHDSLDLRMKDSKLNEMSRWNDVTACNARDLVLRGINECDSYGRNLNNRINLNILFIIDYLN